MTNSLSTQTLNSSRIGCIDALKGLRVLTYVAFGLMGLGLRVWGLGLRVWGVGFRV